MSTKDTIDALSKLENYYLNSEEMELKRLSEEIEYVSKIITTAYVPRFKSAVETLQKIIRIEKIKGKRYDYELFNRLWKGSYDVASIKDSCGDKFMDNQKFAEHCDNCNLRFGQSAAFMNTKDLVIVNKCPALSAMNIVLKALKSIVNEFPDWYERVMDYAELCVTTDSDKITPKEEKKPYKLFYVSSVKVNATDSKTAMNMAEEYLKEICTEPFFLTTKIKNLK